LLLCLEELPHHLSLSDHKQILNGHVGRRRRGGGGVSLPLAPKPLGKHESIPPS
jgi:hypothetical protein